MNEGDRIPYQASAVPVPGARRVLVVAPHPDDEVFGFGGSAAAMAAAGAEVLALILTDGGLWGKPPPGVGVVEARRQEAIRAAQVLGCREPVFGPFADRSLRDRPDLAAYIEEQARRFGADVLCAPSPWEVHPDHAATAMAAVAAAPRVPGLTHLVQYEVGAPLLPNVLVDLTPVWDRKRQAMDCFESQLAMQRYDRHVEALNVQRTYTLGPDVVAAEGLRVATPQEAGEDPFGLVWRGNAHPVRDFILRRQTPA